MGGAGELSRVPLTQLRQRPHEPYDRSHRPSRDDFMPEQPDHLDRGTFLNLAAVVEAGLLLLAWLFGWLAGIDILSDVHINFSGLAWGVAFQYLLKCPKTCISVYIKMPNSWHFSIY